ncbi:MAG TPA: 6-bladed beta-propeller [Vicinamibacterales bacterium]|nr:6-bladed beta-propeller [Vicinamibacterales bacterium]
MTLKQLASAVVLLASATAASSLLAQSKAGEILGPVGPSPYDIVRGWHKPFAEPGFAFGGNSGVFAESPDRIFVAQRGEFRLPTPVPPEFSGFAGSIGVNVLTNTAGRVWKNCLYVLDANGNTVERWTQWDTLCEGSSGPGPHRLRISPYDPERRVWVVNETFHTIYLFSNDGKTLLKTFGEKNVPGSDAAHFARPQDVAFLPDGRILVADGLDNHRVMIFDKDMHYLGEFGSKGTGPGQFNGVHAVAVGPNGLIFALDRSGGRVNVFKTTAVPAKVDFVEAFPGFSLPLDLIVNDDGLWVTDLNPLRFTKLDFKGRHLYTWMVPRELPDGYLEVHTFSVDAQGNLYGGDNQYGRTQKFVPKAGADPAHLIRPPWSAR